MPRIDFGSFYKFVASAGLLMIAGAFALPWVIIQSVAVLNLQESEIDGLTELAGETLRRRQESIALVQDMIWIPSLLFLVSGVVLLSWGLSHWRRRQRVHDETEDLGRDKDKKALEDLTLSEQDEKYEAEEVTSAAADLENSLGEAANLRDATAVAHEAGRDLDREVRQKTREQHIQRAKAVDDAVARKLHDAFGAALDVRQHVRPKGTTGASYALDFVLDPRDQDPWGQLAINVRRFTMGGLWATRLPDLLIRLAMASHEMRSGRVFTGARGRPPIAVASGVLVVAVDVDGVSGPYSLSGPRQLARVVENIRLANQVLVREIGVVAVAEPLLIELDSSALRRLVADAWAKPGEVKLVGLDTSSLADVDSFNG